MPKHSTLETGLATHHVPGMSLAVIHANQLVRSEAHGVITTGQTTPVTPTTLFQACSISKAVTAVAALRLVEAGQITLDADVNAYLWTWQASPNSAWPLHVTLRQLLSHTAGMTPAWFPGYHRAQQLPTLQQVLQGDKPTNTPGVRVNVLPGSRYRYSGGGYCVVQQLLCDVTGLSFSQLMRDLVFNPVGMLSSTFEQPLPFSLWGKAATGHRADGTPLAGQWHVYPEQAAAGLWTTATDLARFAIQLQQAQAGQANALLSQPLAQTMLTPVVARGDGGYMGLGIWLDGSLETGYFGHPGDNEGFACRWVSTRTGGNGVVILTNGDDGWALVEEIVKQIAEEYHWPDPGSNPAVTPATSALPLSAYPGEYLLAGGEILQITAENNELYVQAFGQPPL